MGSTKLPLGSCRPLGISQFTTSTPSLESISQMEETLPRRHGVCRAVKYIFSMCKSILVVLRWHERSTFHLLMSKVRPSMVPSTETSRSTIESSSCMWCNRVIQGVRGSLVQVHLTKRSVISRIVCDFDYYRYRLCSSKI
jgi:hypothetical protein